MYFKSIKRWHINIVTRLVWILYLPNRDVYRNFSVAIPQKSVAARTKRKMTSIGKLRRSVIRVSLFSKSRWQILTCFIQYIYWTTVINYLKYTKPNVFDVIRIKISSHWHNLPKLLCVNDWTISKFLHYYFIATLCLQTTKYAKWCDRI